MPKKKKNAKAQTEAQPAAPAEPAADAATPHTAAGITRGAIPLPVKKAGFVPPNSQGKTGGRGPMPGGKTGGMNLRSTSHTKGARGR